MGPQTMKDGWRNEFYDIIAVATENDPITKRPDKTWSLEKQNNTRKNIPCSRVSETNRPYDAVDRSVWI